MIDQKLFNLVPETRKSVFKIVFFQWISLSMNLVILWNIKRIIDKEIENLWLWFALQTLLFLGKILFISIAKKTSVKTSNRVKTSLRHTLYQFLVRLGSTYREHIPSSTIAQLITEGVDQLEVYFGLYLPQFFYAILAPLTLFVFLSFFNLKVALILLILVPMIPISIIFVQKLAKKVLNRYWGAYTNLNSSFLDSLQGLGTLKAFNMDQMKHEAILEDSETFRKNTMRVLFMQLNSISIMDLVAYGGVMLAVLVAFREYSFNQFSLGTFLMIVLISSEFFIPMRLLGSYFHIAMNGAAAADRIFEFLEIEHETEETITPIGIYNFTARDVSFAYGEKSVLNKLDFDIKAHSFVSFVGESGCGKSTLLSLLSKHLKTDGFAVDEVDLRKLKSADYYSDVVLVSDKSYLFKGSVKENLKITGENADENLIKVLEKVDLWEMFKQRDGLETALLERASNLSGGEKQRLILARALLYDAKVYLFDEITSNVDVKSEAIIMDIIKSLEDKTIIMVSHRLKNVMMSDIIYVMDDGRILEKGNHDTLIQKRGTYYETYSAQRSLERLTEV